MSNADISRRFENEQPSVGDHRMVPGFALNCSKSRKLFVSLRCRSNEHDVAVFGKHEEMIPLSRRALDVVGCNYFLTSAVFDRERPSVCDDKGGPTCASALAAAPERRRD